MLDNTYPSFLNGLLSVFVVPKLPPIEYEIASFPRLDLSYMNIGNGQES